MVKHLYLMRHGETLFYVFWRIQGWCDSPLTERGIKQAKLAKEYLKGIPFDHYYSSSSERACDTLEIVTDGKVPYTRLKGLKECYFGVFEGQSEDLNPPFDKYDTVFPIYGGESGDQLKKRMMDTLTEVMEKEDHQIVLAVSHIGASSNFARLVDPTCITEKFSNCEALHFTYENGKFAFVEKLKLPKTTD